MLGTVLDAAAVVHSIVEIHSCEKGRVAQCHSCKKGRVVQRVQHLYSVTNKGKSLQLFRSAKNNEASALSIYWMHKGIRDLLGSAQSLVKTASW